jgi:hypothetical protein
LEVGERFKKTDVTICDGALGILRALRKINFSLPGLLYGLDAQCDPTILYKVAVSVSRDHSKVK